MVLERNLLAGNQLAKLPFIDVGKVSNYFKLAFQFWRTYQPVKFSQVPFGDLQEVGDPDYLLMDDLLLIHGASVVPYSGGLIQILPNSLPGLLKPGMISLSGIVIHTLGYSYPNDCAS
jgi:hypothetical protein